MREGGFGEMGAAMKPMTVARCVLFVVVLGLATTFTVTAQAGPFEDGLAAFERGDYETALQLLRPLAEQGHAKAQFNLSGMYDNGQGVAQDYAEAVKWYRKAADQGYASAQLNLGLMYESGRHVTQDFVRAHMWFNLATSEVWNNKYFDEAVKAVNRVALLMTPTQIDEAQKLVRERRRK